MWLGILIAIGAIGIGVAIGLAQTLPKMKGQRAKNQAAMASGDLIKRDTNFYKDKEFFVAHIEDQQAFYSALSAAVAKHGVCRASGNYGSRVVFQGIRGKWSAELVRIPSNDGTVRYSFSLSNFEQTGASSFADEQMMSVDLNYILTAIERTFLQFDPRTQVSAQAIAFRSDSVVY